MGNRAVIGFKGQSTGIYLHWNGGEESVRAFLDCAKELGARDPIQDSYGVARLVQVIGNFFGGSMSLGVGNLESLDCNNYDNGTYIVGEGWEIVERQFSPASPGEFDEARYKELLGYCLERNRPFFQPEFKSN